MSPKIASMPLTRSQKVEVLVYFVNVDIVDYVRAFRINIELPLRQELRWLKPSSWDRNDLVVVAMENKNRNVNSLETLGEVGLLEVFDPIVRRFEAWVHSLLPQTSNLALSLLGTASIESKEWSARNFQERLSATFVHGLPKRVEDELFQYPLRLEWSLTKEVAWRQRERLFWRDSCHSCWGNAWLRLHHANVPPS